MGYSLMPPFEDEKEALKNWGKYFDGYCRSCSHKDCEEIRKLRQKTCNLCGKGFEAADKYYENDDKQPQHAACVWEKDEPRQCQICEQPLDEDGDCLRCQKNAADTKV